MYDVLHLVIQCWYLCKIFNWALVTAVQRDLGNDAGQNVENCWAYFGKSFGQSFGHIRQMASKNLFLLAYTLIDSFSVSHTLPLTDGYMWWSPKCILLNCPPMHMVSHMRDGSVLTCWLTRMTGEVSFRLLAPPAWTIASDCGGGANVVLACWYVLFVDYSQTVGNRDTEREARLLVLVCLFPSLCVYLHFQCCLYLSILLFVFFHC